MDTLYYARAFPFGNDVPILFAGVILTYGYKSGMLAVEILVYPCGDIRGNIGI